MRAEEGCGQEEGPPLAAGGWRLCCSVATGTEALGSLVVTRLFEVCASQLAELKALIGYFDVDPNRCFSLLLEALTMQPRNAAFLALVPAFRSAAAVLHGAVLCLCNDVQELWCEWV